MASKILEMAIAIKGQLDGSVGNSFNTLTSRAAALKKQIGSLRSDMRALQKGMMSQDAKGLQIDTVSLQRACAMNKEINALLREQAALNEKRNKAQRYEDAKNHFAGAAQEFAQVASAVIGVNALLGGAVKHAADFEKQMSRVRAISGVSKDQLAMLTDKANEMGMKLPYSAKEAGQAFEYMAMAGWKTEQMMAGIEPVMNLALASGEDLGRVSDIVTDAMTAFGLGADEAGHFSDVLAKTSSNANTNVGLMGYTFQYVAPLAGAMKYSIEDMGLAIGMMANMGVKGQKAGTALRSMLSRLVDPPTEAAEALKNLGVEMTTADGKMRPFRDVLKDLRSEFAGMTDVEKAQVASQIAGTEALSGFMALINTSDADMEKLADSVDHANGATDEMAAIMTDNAAGAWSKFTSAIDIAVNTIGGAFLPAVKDTLEGLADYTGAIGAFLKDNQDLIRSVGVFIEVLGGLALAWKAVNVIMAFGSLVMAASPMTWLILGIAALVAAGYYLYQNWDKILAWLSNEWEYLKNTVCGVVNVIVQYFSECWDRLVSYLQPFFDAISEAATAIWESPAAAIALFIMGPVGWLIGAVVGIISHWEQVKAWFVLLWDDPKTALSQFGDFVMDKIGGIVAWVSEKWETLKNTLASPINGVVNIAKSAVGIAHNAEGGIYPRGAFLTTFAEKGPEAAIPLNGTDRALSLWEQAGVMLGATTGGNSVSAVFSPRITVTGGPDTAAQVSAILDDKMREFETMLHRLAGNDRRLSYE